MNDVERLRSPQRVALVEIKRVAAPLLGDIIAHSALDVGIPTATRFNHTDPSGRANSITICRNSLDSVLFPMFCKSSTYPGIE